MVKKFNLITACGTFDRLHKGHEFFLKRAFEVSQGVLIGITSDKFTRTKPLGFVIQLYTKRKRQLTSFLKKNNLFDRAIIFKLDNVYGPATGKGTKIEGILVTQDTLRGAELVNKKRKALTLPPLKIIKVPLLMGDAAKQYSSWEDRKNLILNNNIVLPNDLRAFLKNPLGKLLKGTEKDLTIAVGLAEKIINKERPKLVITVGDVVTRSFNNAGIPINLAIVDFRIKREEVVGSLTELGFKKEKPDMVVKNPPGTISSPLSSGIKKALEKLNQPQTHNTGPITIRVLGEEDLSVLPAIVFAPNSAYIFYGQPNQGIVYIKVDEEIKTRTLELLAKFKILL